MPAMVAAQPLGRTMDDEARRAARTFGFLRTPRAFERRRAATPSDEQQRLIPRREPVRTGLGVQGPCGLELAAVTRDARRWQQRGGDPHGIAERPKQVRRFHRIHSGAAVIADRYNIYVTLSCFQFGKPTLKRSLHQDRW